MSEAANRYSQKFYIAIIEDDESLARSLARLLLASGYQPITYHSAELFLDDAKRPVFDCMILDIQLDGMSGIDLGARLTSEGSQIPLIYLSAHENWEAIKQSVQPRTAVLLHKSDPGETVLGAIGSLINKNQLQSQGLQTS